ncbi:uncharacterized protein BT62DRAFT_961259 [Guyanagaster necrorhizus]|uniref:DUF2415 domain-containing protein n=1 Tax=Guyanagaster necrorhizus TaxID=856835 RepID=A0A9P7W3H1_9AGAR|nr:uncharacterized protein BT62DRAFT_961259 [Guyanagaster necrorhizus MCA 3950]KAG7451409.1 hypothetical protein BT62DRAFT_961259 [Guyanagaster necrorhizus MCA 3950]
MARGLPLLTSSTPTAIASADVWIGHVQLRDLVVCPKERGVLNYVRQNAIVEQSINVPDSAPCKLVQLPFTPNTLASMQIPNTDEVLLAAGGQKAEIHFSTYAASSSSHGRAKLQWRFEDNLPGSINNSVFLTSLSMTQSHESSIEPRVVISNNDGTVRFFDVPIRTRYRTKLQEAGCLELRVPINHSSISPDGRTLLSVGDTSKVFLHRLIGGSRINIHPIATLSLPPPEASPLPYASTALVASFSTSFSSDGTKYAVASQEGVVAVWDVRSTKPLKTFHTDKNRVPLGHGGATGWLSDDPWEWTSGSCKAPGWSVRSVKFGHGGRNGLGKELMTFTEHTSLLHVVDARTFETEEIIHVPRFPSPPAVQSSERPHNTNHHRQRSPRIEQASRPARSATLPVTSYEVFEPPPPPSSFMFMALEDTFRIPSMSPSSSQSRRRSRLRTSTDLNSALEAMDTYEDDDLVVIPPLGDRQVENDVQTLLGRHGIRSRHTGEDSRDPVDFYYGAANDNQGGEDDMEVDELESDCIPSHTPSRSSSPSPSVHISAPSRYPSFSPVGSPITMSFRQRRAQNERPLETLPRDEDNHLDIAGTCFDPSGAFIYVATTESVAEWSVNGAEKRWWLDNDCWA